MARPLLLLDVDGVLSPLGSDPTTGTGMGTGGWTDWTDPETTGFFLPMSITMGKALADLPCDRAWLTTWQDDANTCIGPVLGWSALPVLPRSTSGPVRERWWKLDAAVESLTHDPRPVVWIDDDLRSHNRAARTALTALGVPFLLVSPRRDVGLTNAQVNRITRWISDL